MYAIVARPAGRSRPDREASQVTRPRDARWDDYGSTAEPMGPDPAVVATFSDLQREIMGAKPRVQRGAASRGHRERGGRFARVLRDPRSGSRTAGSVRAHPPGLTRHRFIDNVS